MCTLPCVFFPCNPATSQSPRYFKSILPPLIPDELSRLKDIAEGFQGNGSTLASTGAAPTCLLDNTVKAVPSLVLLSAKSRTSLVATTSIPSSRLCVDKHARVAFHVACLSGLRWHSRLFYTPARVFVAISLRWLSGRLGVPRATPTLLSAGQDHRPLIGIRGFIPRPRIDDVCYQHAPT